MSVVFVESPDLYLPARVEGRSMSFAPEFYATFRRVHRRTHWVLQGVFPHPLAMTDRALWRARLTGDGRRGGRVVVEGERGGAVEGRTVGRHPRSGAPVVAWNPDAYTSMCDAFDAENAARIVVWQRVGLRLAFSTATCTRWALRADQGLRLLLLLCILLPLGVGATSSPELMFLGGISGAAVGLSLLVGLGGLGPLAISMGGMGLALGVGLWGAWAARRARVRDEAGRTSAAALLAAMRSVRDGEGDEGRGRAGDQGP